MFHPKNQQGVLILLALVMTMVLLVSSSVIATITIRESRISGIVDKGLTAFYSGESAAESALFDIFKNLTFNEFNLLFLRFELSLKLKLINGVYIFANEF